MPQFAHTEIHDRHEFLRSVYRGTDLQPGDAVPIEFLPEPRGVYGFACQMGMLRGKLIVE